LQTGSFVFGFEADVQGTGADQSIFAGYGPIVSANPAFTIAPHTETVSDRLDWYSTVRGRLGFTWDYFLAYGTGGLVVGGVTSRTDVAFGNFGVNPVYNNAVHVGSFSEDRTGWVAGGGLEYALSHNWSIKGEYLHLDLGSFNYHSPLIAPAGVASGYSWSTHVRNSEEVARVGINYRFGDCCREYSALK
jgi:outer membrane immunogenic protein